MRTVTAILRERIKKFGGKEFILKDLLYDDGSLTSKDHKDYLIAAPAAICKMSYGNPSEITTIRTERQPNRVRVNVYVENKIKTSKMLTEKALKNDYKPAKNDPWMSVYPEYFEVPKFTGNKTSRYNHCSDLSNGRFI